jgi:hypothetical protein
MEFRMNLLDGMDQIASDTNSKEASVGENKKKKVDKLRKSPKLRRRATGEELVLLLSLR